MKKIIIIFFIYLLQFSLVTANTKIGFIDMDKIMSTSKPGSSIIKQLKKINTNNIDKFENDAKKLKELETKLIAQKNLLSDSDFQLKINKLKLDIKNYNDARKIINSDFNKLKIDTTNKFLKMINPILTKYIDINSISLILKKRDIVIGKKELDITDEIIKIINNDIKKFNIQ